MEKFGIILIDKPVGISSRKVVNIYKKKFNIKKIGHAGTLDPLASGLLILLLNKATKLSKLISKSDKIYQFTISFGSYSTTDDLEGNIIEKIECNEPTKKFIIEILKKFKGKIKQVPPRYSAIKINGQRAYKLARKGISFDIKEREIEIKNIALINWEWPEIELIVLVSTGTYIRSLARDIGKESGFGAYTKSIRRISIGNNYIDESLKINEEISEVQKLILKDPIKALSNYKKKIIDLKNYENYPFIEFQEKENSFILIDKDNKFIGIAEFKENNIYKIKILKDKEFV